MIDVLPGILVIFTIFNTSMISIFVCVCVCLCECIMAFYIF